MLEANTAGGLSGNEFEVLRLNEEKLKALLHLLPIGISILNSERKPIYTNPALDEILGLSENELRGGKYAQRKYLRTDGNDMPNQEFPSTQAFDTGKAVQDVEIGIVKEDGSTIWTMVSAVPLSYGDWQVVLTVIDITDRKQAHSILQAQTTELLWRVKALNCLYNMADLVERPGITLDEIIRGTTDLIPTAYPNPESTWTRIIFNQRSFTSANFKHTHLKQTNAIIVYGERLGMVEIYFNPDLEHIQPKDQNLLKAISERLGRIIERFQAEEKLVELATTDPLTGLYNRRHFFEIATLEIERSKRYNHPVACIMFDVDFFKKINDSFGHLFGDQVLQEMVKRCRINIRSLDIFARYGGDEFVILLPETGPRRALRQANRLINTFRSQDLQVGNVNTSITLSMGIASMNGDSDLMLDTLLVRADQALYASKAKGRNRICVWTAGIS